MKNLLLAVICLLLCSTCKKEANFLFSMNYDLEFTIQPGLNPFGGIYGYKIKSIPTNYTDYLAVNNRTEEEITKIASASAKVSALFTGAGYDFIQDATIYIANTTDTTFFKPVFERYQIPHSTGSQLELIGTLVDAAPILSEETFEVWFEMTLRDYSPELIRSRLELEFHAQGE